MNATVRTALIGLVGIAAFGPVGLVAPAGEDEGPGRPPRSSSCP